MRLSELNHEVLGACQKGQLVSQRCFCNQGKDQMLATSQVKQISRKEEAKSTRDRRSQVFLVLKEQKGCQDRDLLTPSCLHGTNESQKSTRQIKKVCQDNDLPKPSCLQDKDIQAKKTSTKKIKNLHSIFIQKEVQCSITEAGVQRSITSSIVIRRRNINVKIINNPPG